MRSSCLACTEEKPKSDLDFSDPWPNILNDVNQAIAEATKKKKLAAIAQMRFAALAEGRCAQILHIGPFSAEGPTIAKVHQFIAARGKLHGKHHEIYLSDIRKADPAKWKTIIRQPMQS